LLADFFFPFSARAPRPREAEAFFLPNADPDKLRETKITRIKEMTEMSRPGLGVNGCKVIRAKLPFLGITYRGVSTFKFSWTLGIKNAKKRCLRPSSYQELLLQFESFKIPNPRIQTAKPYLQH
jgi:hypothetical protein